VRIRVQVHVSEACVVWMPSLPGTTSTAPSPRPRFRAGLLQPVRAVFLSPTHPGCYSSNNRIARRRRRLPESSVRREFLEFGRSKLFICAVCPPVKMALLQLCGLT